MQKCAHGNAFNFSDGTVGELRNLNCPNWGSEGACLLSTVAGKIIAGPCGGPTAQWAKHTTTSVDGALI